MGSRWIPAGFQWIPMASKSIPMDSKQVPRDSKSFAMDSSRLPWIPNGFQWIPAPCSTVCREAARLRPDQLESFTGSLQWSCFGSGVSRRESHACAAIEDVDGPENMSFSISGRHGARSSANCEHALGLGACTPGTRSGDPLGARTQGSRTTRTRATWIQTRRTCLSEVALQQVACPLRHALTMWIQALSSKLCALCISVVQRSGEQTYSAPQRRRITNDCVAQRGGQSLLRCSTELSLGYSGQSVPSRRCLPSIDLVLAL